MEEKKFKLTERLKLIEPTSNFQQKKKRNFSKIKKKDKISQFENREISGKFMANENEIVKF